MSGYISIALFIGAGICLLTSIGLAIANKVAGGTLAAGLFVACVLFLCLPQMRRSFKAFGIEVEWVSHQLDVLKDQITTGAPRDKLMMSVDQAIGANNAPLSAAQSLTAAQKYRRALGGAMLNSPATDGTTDHRV